MIACSGVKKDGNHNHIDDSAGDLYLVNASGSPLVNERLKSRYAPRIEVLPSSVRWYLVEVFGLTVALYRISLGASYTRDEKIYQDQWDDVVCGRIKSASMIIKIVELPGDCRSEDVTSLLADALEGEQVITIGWGGHPGQSRMSPCLVRQPLQLLWIERCSLD
jgi:hypothetical protein